MSLSHTKLQTLPSQNNIPNEAKKIKAIINSCAKIDLKERKSWFQYNNVELTDSIEKSLQKDANYFATWYAELALRFKERRDWILEINNIFDELIGKNGELVAEPLKSVLIKYKKDLIVEVCTTKGKDHPVRAARELHHFFKNPSDDTLNNFKKTTENTGLHPSTNTVIGVMLLMAPFWLAIGASFFCPPLAFAAVGFFGACIIGLTISKCSYRSSFLNRAIDRTIQFLNPNLSNSVESVIDKTHKLAYTLKNHSVFKTPNEQKHTNTSEQPDYVPKGNPK